MTLEKEIKKLREDIINKISKEDILKRLQNIAEGVRYVEEKVSEYKLRVFISEDK